MLQTSFAISACLHTLLQEFAPTNIVIRAVRTRRGHK